MRFLKNVKRFYWVVFSIMVLGVSVTYALFTYNNAIPYWIFAKPVSIVKIAEQSGHIEINPIQSPSNWLQDSINVHSYRSAMTALFLELHYVTGMEVLGLAMSPFGVVIFLLGFLFLFKQTEEKTYRIGFLIASILFIFNYPMLTSFFHGGGWPGAALGYFMIGSLLGYVRKGSRRYLGFSIVFLMLIFETYHAIAWLSYLLHGTLFIYVLSLKLASRLGLSARTDLQPYLVFLTTSLCLATRDFLFTSQVRGSWWFIQHTWDPLGNFFIFGQGYSDPLVKGFSSATKVPMIMPLLYMFVLMTYMWVRDMVMASKRRLTLMGIDMVIHGLYLTATLAFLASLILTKWPRLSESYYLLLIATPLLIVTRRREARRIIVISLTLLLIAVASFAVVIHEPLIRATDANPPIEAAAKWYAFRIDNPYFADSWFANLIMCNNPCAPIISNQADVSSVQKWKFLYLGPAEFAAGLKQRGAMLVVLRNENIEAPSSYAGGRFLLMSDVGLQPLPNYDFSLMYFEIVYTNGFSIAMILT